MQHVKFIRLHETNVKYENLNSMKSQLHYYHTTCCRWSYLVNSVHEYFTATDSHLQISQHQVNLKTENFTVSYHSYTYYYNKTICSCTSSTTTMITSQKWIISTLWSKNNSQLLLLGTVSHENTTATIQTELQW